MFNSTILDVAIGMVFIYLLLSLMCSAANELIELVLKKRARELERGISELLTNQKTENFVGHLASWVKGFGPRLESWVKGASTDESKPTGIVALLYNHALINGLFKGKYEAGSRRLPAYIPATSFALALMDLASRQLTSPPGGMGSGEISSPPSGLGNPLHDLRDGVANLPEEFKKVKDALIPLIDAAGNDVATARLNIETWYNSSMDRVSGWYKRRAQIIIFFLGLVVAVAINVDSVIVAKRLSTDKSLRDSLVAAADAYAEANAKATPTPTPTGSPAPPPSASPDPCLKDACNNDPNSPQCKLRKSQCELSALNLPIGWNSPNDGYLNSPGWRWQGPGGWWDQITHHFFGWLLTALALSLGAPFWFDMLNKIMVVRATVKPKEKSPDEGSKD